MGMVRNTCPVGGQGPGPLSQPEPISTREAFTDLLAGLISAMALRCRKNLGSFG